MILADVLADPQLALSLDQDGWTDLLCTAQAERLAGTLAYRLNGLPLPEQVGDVLRIAEFNAEIARTRALWEVEMMRRALAPIGVPLVLLKGSAFLAAGLSAGQGRLVGDLDILVPRKDLPQVEAELLQAGWEWLKSDAYDDRYYRTWMHELPPLIHRDRDVMIDVHHTILPLTARPTPDSAAMIRDSVEIAPGLRMLCPADMIVHAAAHLLADGDLSGGLRNLWDIRCLTDDVPADLHERSALHGLSQEVERALRLADAVFGHGELRFADRLYASRIVARDGWGRETRRALRTMFYVRSHLIRMPMHLLLRHLFVKWRKGRAMR